MENVVKKGKLGLSSQMILFCGLIFISARIAVQFFLPINHDFAADFYRTVESLFGAGLYTEIVDPYPPMLFWLQTPAAWISAAFNLPIKYVAYTFVLVLVGGLFLVSYYLLSNNIRFTNIGRMTVFVVLMVLLLFLPSNGFGQREQFIIALILPYLLSVSLQLYEKNISPGARVFYALLAIIAAMIKPHYLIALVGMELFFVIRKGIASLFSRVELLVMLVAGAAYLGLLYWLTPEYFTWLPLVLKVYPANNNALMTVLLFPGNLLIIPVIMAFFLNIKIMERCGFAEGMLASTSLLLIVAIFQMKGWGFQYVPFQLVAIFFVVYAIIRWVENSKSFGRMKSVLFGICFAMFALLAVTTSLQMRNELEEAKTMMKFVQLTQEHAQGEPIYYFSRYHHQPVWPAVVEGNAQWKVRFSRLFHIRSFYPRNKNTYRELEAMEPEEKLFYNSVIVDLVNNPPALMIFPRPARVDGFDFREYFQRDFRFQELFSKYEELPEVVDNSVKAIAPAYKVFKRVK